MKKTIYIFLTLFMASMLFNGCSKEVDVYNKPAVYWYSKIIDSISNGNYDKADDYYSSLQGEHIGSPLLPEATMILAIAHMHNEEYLLTEHFLNEYIKRYANENEIEFAEYLRIKAKYKSLPRPRRDQVFIRDAIQEAESFELKHPNSMYFSLVDSMLTRLYLGDAAFNESIAGLYDRVDKPRSAAYYRSIDPQPWINWNKVERAHIPWYREWFVGDGTSSWYAFLIPDTKSVVSRNTVNYIENNTTK
ncbi:outer membrane protein assembly factor BamD [Sulfurimonas sp.]